MRWVELTDNTTDFFVGADRVGWILHNSLSICWTLMYVRHMVYVPSIEIAKQQLLNEFKLQQLPNIIE